MCTGKRRSIYTGQYYIRANPVHQQKAKCIKNPYPEILNGKDIFYGSN